MLDRERLPRLRIDAPVGFCREHLLLNGDARSSVARFPDLHDCVLRGEGGHERLVRGPRDLDAPGFRQCRVRPAWNDIDDSGVVVDAGLNVGAYTVTVSLSGFKTFIVNDVVLTSGAGANLRAVLDVGGLTEQVTVTSSSEIVQTRTQAPTIRRRSTRARSPSCRLRTGLRLHPSTPLRMP
jgi:hypothetical protein